MLTGLRSTDTVPSVTTWQLTQTGVDQYTGTLTIGLSPASLAGAGSFTSRVPGLTKTTQISGNVTFFGSPSLPRTFAEVRMALALR